ncbi:MAG: PilZ domain-containing protein [Candidatus Omnitrophica bacterium]|nr:PilZ domain-containing protein [Candidatus Omnitrophota bacterium]
MTDITQEKRKLLRLAHKVPVEFRVLDNQQVLIPGVDQQRGQTRNVSTGGACIETEALNESTIRYLNQQNILLHVYFHLPLTHHPVPAVAQIAWYERIEGAAGVSYVLGLQFRSIKSGDAVALLRQSVRFKVLALAVLILTGIFVASLIYHFQIAKS